MKTRSLLTCVMLLVHNLLFAQVKPGNAHLQRVTIYLQGAHLYYQENVNLVAGNNEFVFESISPSINTASLQASSKGGVVMDVKHQLKYREKPIVTRKYDMEIRQVTDSLDALRFDLKNISNKMQVLTTEKNMLLNNQLIRGQSANDSLPLLKEAMSFLRDKLNNIYDLELKWEKTKAVSDRLLARLNDRHAELLRLQSGEDNGSQVNTRPVNQVVVSVYSETAGSSVISFNYYIRQASWVPLYDLQASSATNAFQLKYFANVVQQSGIEWKNVPLTLSTSNPDENNSKPSLSPWMIALMDQLRKPVVNYNLSNSMRGIQAESTVKIQQKKALTDASVAAAEVDMEKFVSMTENLIRTEYEIKLNYTIASDGLAHKVMVNQRDVPMQLQFAAVPKLCTDAFLMANVTGWEDMNIIPGAARLYFDGTYVGEMFLDAGSTSDTLSVNLGRDKTIALTRKKIKDKCKVGFMDNDKVETRTIELTVRNTKNIAVEMVLEDQIPVAQGNGEIKVKLLNSDGAELDEPTGLLKWKLKLNSKETKKVVFTYEVRYPKSKVVAGL